MSEPRIQQPIEKRASRVAPEKAAFRPVLMRVPFAGSLPEKKMAKLTYAEQLRHPNWQKRRLERLSLANWECEGCCTKDITLHVHHKQYIKGRMAWEYSDGELAVWCENCHGDHHLIESLLQRVLSVEVAYESPHRTALGLIAGYLAAHFDLDYELSEECRKHTGPIFDIGIAAGMLALHSRPKIAAALAGLGDPGVRLDPVTDDLIARWSKPESA